MFTFDKCFSNLYIDLISYFYSCKAVCHFHSRIASYATSLQLTVGKQLAYLLYVYIYFVQPIILNKIMQTEGNHLA